MSRDKKNIAKSVHQRLLNKARETKRPFNELLQYYAMEKFLLRMSLSPYAEEFVLKGALLLRSFGITEIRATRDIDVLKYGEHTIPEVEKVIAECCTVEIEEDGLEFDPESVSGQEIREQQAYQGIRISVRGNLGNARIHLQIEWWWNQQGKQPGDPAKLAQALIKIINEEPPPRRFIAGSDAIELVEQKAAELQEQANAYRELSTSLAH